MCFKFGSLSNETSCLTILWRWSFVVGQVNDVCKSKSEKSHKGRLRRRDRVQPRINCGGREDDSSSRRGSKAEGRCVQLQSEISKYFALGFCHSQFQAGDQSYFIARVEIWTYTWATVFTSTLFLSFDQMITVGVHFECIFVCILATIVIARAVPQKVVYILRDIPNTSLIVERNLHFYITTLSPHIYSDFQYPARMNLNVKTNICPTVLRWTL